MDDRVRLVLNAEIMRPTAAFSAALVSAAAAFILIQDALWGWDWNVGHLVFGVVLFSVCGLPVVLLGGVPVWLVYRRRGISSVWAFASAGAVLAALTFLLLLGIGVWHGFFEEPEPFLKALANRYHLVQLLDFAASGAIGAIVFWLIEVRPPQRSGAGAGPMS